MKTAVQIAITTCFKCKTSYTYGAFAKLADIAETTRTDGTVVVVKRCEHCDNSVASVGFHDMDPAVLWRDWALHRSMYPDSRAQPVLIPENNAERISLWWMRNRVWVVALVVGMAILLLIVALAGAVQSVAAAWGAKL